MKTIFHLEDRGIDFIFHWVSYMLVGLRHLDTGKHVLGYRGGGAYEKNTHLYQSGNVTKPYYVFISKPYDDIHYVNESLDIISNDFILIKESDIDSDDIVVNNFGEPFYDNGFHLEPEAYIFLRNLFLNKLNFQDSIHKNKKYFIRRDKSHLLVGNKNQNEIKRRQIINESELVSSLKNFGYESIYLEDFSFKEKIEIFYFSSVILSPNSGALTFSIFSGHETKIIEINTGTPHQIHHQYKSQCDALNIPYYKFISKKIDINDNMYVDINSLCELVKNI